MDVLNIARYIVNYSNEKKYNISNLSLQKLLYFVQAYYLAFTPLHKPCFDDEIEAWDFGPVVPRVYREFRRFGGGHIPPIEQYILFTPENIWNSQVVDFNENVIPKADRKIIQSVVDNFKNYSATDLVSLTHSQRPWKEAFAHGGNRIISKSAIRGYFEN